MEKGQAINLNKVIYAMLLLEAERWAGMKEQGGNNKGQVVQMFQEAVDGRATNESWCMGKVQSDCMWALRYFETAHPHISGYMKLALYPSEHCLTVWNKTDKICRTTTPYPGCIVIWQHGNTANGHTGIVKSINGDKMVVIEGNTGDGVGVVRDGDGVYVRNRSVTGDGNMRVVGFLEPFVFPVPSGK